MGPTVQVDIVLVQHLLNFWDREGIDIVPVLALLGIAESNPLPPWIGADKLRLAQSRIDELCSGTFLSVRSGIYLGQRDLPMAQLLCYAENLAQGLPAALRFAHRSVGLAKIQIEPADGHIILRAHAADGTSLTDAECQQTLSALAQLCRLTLGNTYCYSDIEVCFSCVSDTATGLQKILQLPVCYAGYCGLKISADAWIRVNPRHHLLSFVDTLRDLERKEKKLNEHLRLYSELRGIIEECLLRRHVSQEDVAGQLDISVRNLQRRLKALGTTYQILLDESRQNLSMKLIKNDAIPLYEIAYMVGYAEPSAFYKAFKRWTGSTPGDYRTQTPVVTDA